MTIKVSQFYSVFVGGLILGELVFDIVAGYIGGIEIKLVIRCLISLTKDLSSSRIEGT